MTSPTCSLRLLGNAVFERTDYGCAFGIPACAEPALLYLETNANLQNHGQGSTTLFVSSNAGQQEFTFASGSSQANIIAAINTFEAQLGLTAEQCPKNTDRVILRSTFVHELAFVEVRQVGGTPPIVVPMPVGGTLSYSVLTFGESALQGDANCDRTINTSDLLSVIEQWGTCSVMQSFCAADLTGNGAVDVDDLLIVVVHWGASP